MHQYKNDSKLLLYLLTELGMFQGSLSDFGVTHRAITATTAISLLWHVLSGSLTRKHRLLAQQTGPPRLQSQPHIKHVKKCRPEILCDLIS